MAYELRNEPFMERNEVPFSRTSGTLPSFRKPVTASRSYPGDEAKEAVDLSMHSHWVAGDGAPQWGPPLANVRHVCFIVTTMKHNEGHDGWVILHEVEVRAP